MIEPVIESPETSGPGRKRWPRKVALAFVVVAASVAIPLVGISQSVSAASSGPNKELKQSVWPRHFNFLQLRHLDFQFV